MTPVNRNHSTIRRLFKYRTLKEKKRYWIVTIPIIFIFTIFSFLSLHGTLQPYWILFVLLSISSGISVYLLTQCVTYFFKLKNKHFFRKKLIPYSLIKKTKKKIILFSFSIGFCIFWFMFLLFLQPSADGTHETLQLSDLIGGIIMNIAFSLVIYLLLIHLFTWVTGTDLIQNKKPHNNLSSLEDFQEHTFHSHHNKNSWNDWDHDPMNPASPEYQSTYRHWSHDH